MKGNTSSEMGWKEGKIGVDPEKLQEGKEGKVKFTLDSLFLYRVEGKVICRE